MCKLWQRIKTAYNLLRVLSLDVALGAVAMAYLWAVFLDTSASFVVYMVLALAVWLIYTLDHLLDAHQIKHTAHTIRHQFHQKYFYVLSWCAGLASLAGVGLLFLLTWKVWFWGSMVLGLVIVHFLLSFFLHQQSYFLLQKELRVALGYSLGVAVGILSTVSFSAIEWVSAVWLLVLVMGLAWYNLLLIARYEYDSDVKDAQSSLAVSLGVLSIQKLLSKLSIGLLIYFLIGVYFLIPSFQYQIFILLLLMLLTLELVRRFEEYFKQKERYRTWADAIFLYPLILLILRLS